MSIVAILETVWVSTCLQSRKLEIAAAVERMLQAAVLVVENEQDIFTAMVALKKARALSPTPSF